MPSRSGDAARLAADTVTAIEVFGHQVRATLLASLLREGPAARSELADRVQVPSSTARHHLLVLERSGVVTTFPARDDDPDVRSRRYEVDPARVRALIEALADDFGEH